MSETTKKGAGTARPGLAEELTVETAPKFKTGQEVIHEPTSTRRKVLRVVGSGDRAAVSLEGLAGLTPAKVCRPG